MAATPLREVSSGCYGRVYRIIITTVSSTNRLADHLPAHLRIWLLCIPEDRTDRGIVLIFAEPALRIHFKYVKFSRGLVATDVDATVAGSFQGHVSLPAQCIDGTAALGLHRVIVVKILAVIHWPFVLIEFPQAVEGEKAFLFLQRFMKAALHGRVKDRCFRLPVVADDKGGVFLARDKGFGD